MIRKDKTRISQEQAIIREAIRCILREETLGIGPDRVRYVSPGGSLPTSLYNLDSKGKPTRDPGVAVLTRRRRKALKNEGLLDLLKKLITTTKSDANSEKKSEKSVTKDTVVPANIKSSIQQQDLGNPIIDALKSHLSIFTDERIANVRKLSEQLKNELSKMPEVTDMNALEYKARLSQEILKDNDLKQTIDKVMDLFQAIEGFLNNKQYDDDQKLSVANEIESLPNLDNFNFIIEVLQNPPGTRASTPYNSVASLSRAIDTLLLRSLNTQDRRSQTFSSLSPTVTKKSKTHIEIEETDPVGKIFRMAGRIREKLEKILPGKALSVFLTDLAEKIKAKTADKNVSDAELSAYAGEIIEKFDDLVEKHVPNPTKDQNRIKSEISAELFKTIQNLNVKETRIRNLLFNSGRELNTRTAACAILLLCLTN